MVGWYQDQIVPRLVDCACGARAIRRWRQRAAEGLAGSVVEIGFGSGLNVPFYPGDVSLVWAVEPSVVATGRAATRVENSPIPVEFVGLDARALALADESCDAALCTFTLCTVPDVALVLSEIRRVLRPGGRLHLLEHGLSPEGSVARWQRRLDPLERRVAGGCHLTREPLALVTEAGFVERWSEQRYAKGPKPWSYFTVAVAEKPLG